MRTKWSRVLMVAAFAFALTGCKQEQSVKPDVSSVTTTESSADRKTLIAYFSWSSAGNTEKMANGFVK